VLERLSSRWFVVRDAHDGESTFLVQPRWAMSLLRGPMTEGEIRRAVSGTDQHVYPHTMRTGAIVLMGLLLMTSELAAQRARSVRHTVQFIPGGNPATSRAPEVLGPGTRAFSVPDVDWRCVVSDEDPMTFEDSTIVTRTIECQMAGTPAVVTLVASCCRGSLCSVETRSASQSVGLRAASQSRGTTVVLACEAR
jgi:hypothetical protein